jgi:hypothetical protein
MVIDTKSLPRWIDKTTDCIFCGKQSEMTSIDIVDNTVEAWYVCNNKKCDCIVYVKRKAKQGLVYSGAARIDIYRKQLEKDKGKPA